MGAFSMFAVLAALVPLRAFGESPFGRRAVARRAAAYASSVVLVAAFAAYMMWFDLTVVAVRPASLAAGLPIAFLIRRLGELAPASRVDELLLLTVLEALALGVFLANLGALSPRARRPTVGVVAATLAAVALVVPASESADPYLYVALATLGVHAYAPPATAFGGELHALNAIWGTPILSSAYGPVWIAFSWLLLAPLGSLAAKLAALRLLGLGSVLLCAYLARRLGAAPAVVAGIACNPAIYVQYVSSAHNDLLGTDAVLAAMLAARRNVVLAFALALAASLIKVTFAPIAVVAVAALPSVRARVAFACALALAVAAVYGIDRGLLWHALMAAAAAYRWPQSPLDLALRAALVVVALANTGLAVLGRPIRPQAAWATTAFGQAPLAWYTAWGLPFVVACMPVAVTYLVSLPVLSFFSNTTFPSTPGVELAGSGVVLVAIFVAAYRLRPGGHPVADGML